MMWYRANVGLVVLSSITCFNIQHQWVCFYRPNIRKASQCVCISTQYIATACSRNGHRAAETATRQTAPQNWRGEGKKEGDRID